MAMNDGFIRMNVTSRPSIESGDNDETAASTCSYCRARLMQPRCTPAAPPIIRAGHSRRHHARRRARRTRVGRRRSRDGFRQTEPAEGAPATHDKRARAGRAPVPRHRHRCDEPDPAGIVSFSVRRDAVLDSEDHIRIVLGPFARRAVGLRLRRQSERRPLRRPRSIPAARATIPTGTASGRPRRRGGRPAGAPRSGFPILTLSFKPGLHEWHFNVQRRIQRLLETDRWASPERQYQVTQTSRAGPAHRVCRTSTSASGLSVRPARDRRRRHAGARRAASKANFNPASTSRSASARTCSRRRR